MHVTHDIKVCREKLDEDITPMVTTPSISLTDGNISFDMQEKTYQ